MLGLHISTLILPAAELGLDNPMPPLGPLSRSANRVQVHPTVPASARRYLGWGCDTGCLPYLLRDGYGRRRAARAFKVAILENQVLRATFLLELGGRLWSLWHKPSGRELLFSNPVFQPANLAVCNAWFSGGVEWNASIPGHSPLTCSSVFAARVAAHDGSPMLRLYEWERIRGVPYQIDFTLPDGSPWLLARVRITNPHPRTIPMYWWSNIAVAERPEVRVLVPAQAAYRFGYAGVMQRVPVPRHDDQDVSYPTNLRSSADFFYDIPPGQRPWIAALDGEGRGLIQTSTAAQRGRKLFVWGMGPGGRRWQDFLSTPEQRYIEIQAGVAQTQYECFPMEAQSELCWMEAYGLMEADAAAVHGRSWAGAQGAVQSKLDRSLAASRLERALAESAADADHPPDEVFHQGAGWGALEASRRAVAGEKFFCSAALRFDPATIGPQQAPWMALLETGALPEADAAEAPGAYMVQDEWRNLVEHSTRQRPGDHWLSWLHLGVMWYVSSQPQRARQAWRRSLELCPSAWALRNLAWLEAQEGHPSEASGLYEAARQMMPHLACLTVECLRALVDAGSATRVLAMLEALPPAVRRHSRVRILEARAAMDARDLERAESILLDPDLELPDLREGELLLSDLWYTLQERKAGYDGNGQISPEARRRIRRECPPPPRIDFRMAGIDEA